jgi:hypothetical protein
MAPTYYPGTTDASSAQTIALAPAQTLTALEFAMVSRAAHRVSGTVVDAGGSPVAHAIVMLRIDPRRGGGPNPAAALTDETGAFQIGGLAAATYQITIGGGGAGRTAVGGVSVAGGGRAASGVATRPSQITIRDQDVSGLTIVMITSR